MAGARAHVADLRGRGPQEAGVKLRTGHTALPSAANRDMTAGCRTSKYGGASLLLRSCAKLAQPTECLCHPPAAEQLRAYDGDEEKVLEKLRDWKDPDSETNEKKRPLHRALARGHVNVAKHLIMYRADAWKKEGGKTAAMVALEHQKGSGLLELLKETHKDDKAPRAGRYRALDRGVVFGASGCLGPHVRQPGAEIVLPGRG